jgi:hypothetical protein
MRLNVKALMLAVAIFWALVVLLIGLANLIWPRYGTMFLQVIASVYPGYNATRSIGDLIAGTLYALVDGGITGWALGWLYNHFAIPSREEPKMG